ncbi:MAG: DUF2891 domain-containing protein [Flavobacteriaceae bacterium]|jgi:hypothetical protein|nr:DUF2891 domain-containing protein [Flavobacteriaceae bacterium]
MKKYLILFTALLIISCNKEQQIAVEKEEPIALTFHEANNLAKLPLHCITQEYPNKLGQVLGSDEDLKSPKALRPAFYGCFDWHSAVHGHWSLVVLLNKFPELDNREEIILALEKHLTKENIETEVAFFNDKNNLSFERTYGWAWLLKLAEALHESENPRLKQLEQNLQPLTGLMVEKYIEFLPKLLYPIRVGEHSNTAFGLSLAWDYAVSLDNKEFQQAIKSRALDYYQNDISCPLNWEPSGYDFLSPCLEEACLMSKILDKNEFEKWLDKFLPELKNPDFRLETAKVSDREDGKLVHLDGLNFSRAWCLKAIADKSEKCSHLVKTANEHIEFSLPNLVSDSYEGGHWLGTFAIYSMM